MILQYKFDSDKSKILYFKGKTLSDFRNWWHNAKWSEKMFFMWSVWFWWHKECSLWFQQPWNFSSLPCKVFAILAVCKHYPYHHLVNLQSKSGNAEYYVTKRLINYSSLCSVKQQKFSFALSFFTWLNRFQCPVSIFIVKNFLIA